MNSAGKTARQLRELFRTLKFPKHTPVVFHAQPRAVPANQVLGANFSRPQVRWFGTATPPNPPRRTTATASNNMAANEVGTSDVVRLWTASPSGTAHVSPNELRGMFAAAMSDMYREEVPLYGTLLELVGDVNSRTSGVIGADEPARVEVERHGAIRLGTARELRTMGRVLAVMGLHPVDYYDLTLAGVPVHATAFRPIHNESLGENPFRLFTSLLRLDLIGDPELRAKAQELLDARQIFSPRLIELTDLHQRAGGLTAAEAEEFVKEAVDTFRWHSESPVSAADYEKLRKQHPLIADVVCFKGPHINHLTPRTLDIDAVQRMMIDRGIRAKKVIEGPPPREFPILLRQTSFEALTEQIEFADGVEGAHKARFGEVEQRGIALTPKGRALYDRLLEQTRTEAAKGGNYETELARAFAEFPDDIDTLRREGLAFFRYELTELGRAQASEVGTHDMETLIERGFMHAVPITYEDFLPVSAAGIFQSNLSGQSTSSYAAQPARDAFEQALGRPTLSSMELYAVQQERSLHSIRVALVANQMNPGDDLD
jgi:uncharacterized glyoxalase superfamily metalloenzyme YdcJ